MNYNKSLRLLFILAKVSITLLKSKFSKNSFLLFKNAKKDNRIAPIVERLQLYICFILLKLRFFYALLAGKML